MSDVGASRWIGPGSRLHGFQDLARYRVHDILLVSSLYDSFILAEDGQLNELILSEFLELNLSHTPGLTRVSSGAQALALAREEARYNLIITSMHLGDMNALALARKVREAGLDIPVILFASDDNSPVRPSVVVSELIDVLQAGYGLPADPAAGRLVTRHRLQAFSADYFQVGSGLFSYSAEDLQACAAASAATSPQPFAPEAVPLTSEDAAAWSRPDLGASASFFGNPAKFFVRNRLGVRLEPPQASVSDSEPYAMKGLERFTIGSRLLEQRLSCSHPRDVFSTLRAEGRLPHGTMGEVEFRDLGAEVDRFARRLEALRPAASPEAISSAWWRTRRTGCSFSPRTDSSAAR